MPTGVDRRVGELLERLGRSEDFPGCCSALLHHILASRPDGKGLIVARSRGLVRVSGWRVAASAVRSAEARALEEGSDLARLMEGEQLPSGRLRMEGLVSRVVLPLTPGPFQGGGVLLAEGLEDEDEIRRAAEVLDRCSPVLLRALEMEALQARVDRLEKEGALRSRMVEAISDPVLLTDGKGNIVTANARAHDLFFGGPDDGEGRARAVRLNAFLFSTRLTEAAIPSQGGTRRELNLVDPRDGGDLLFEMRTDRLKWPGSDEGYLISVLREVTDVKRAAEELRLEFRRSRAAEHRARQESKRLHAILENVAEPILVTDPGSEIVLMNREAEDLFQVERHGSGPEERAPVRWANVSRLAGFVSDLLLSRESRSVDTLALVHPERGEEFPVEATGVLLKDEKGEATAVVTVLRDLTPVVENERLARELRMLNEALEDRIEEATHELAERNRLLEWQSRELERASQLKSQFLANMSHELRTPINAMLGYVSLLQERIFGPLNEGQDGALTKVETASEHLLALINDILDLSKIEAGKMPLRIDELDLAALIGEVHGTMELLTRDRPVRVRMDVSKDLPPVRSDRTKLRQVLLNLLENAVKFTEEGTVTVRARPHRGGEWVLVQVEDTGVGMAEDDLEHVFDDFRQGDGSRTRLYGGAGLGLSISRRLVSLLEGTISVTSALGKGSCFTVELPSELKIPAEGTAEHLPFPVGRPLPSREQLMADGHPGPPEGDGHEPEDTRSDISHGLKNPLQGIVGYAELMEMGRYGDLDPEMKDAVEKIVLHGRNMSGRLDVAIGLLNMAMEAARAPSGQSASLADAARLATRRLADQAADMGTDLEVAIEAEGPYVSSSPDRLVTLLLALFRVSLVHGSPGTLRLRADEAETGLVRLYVDCGNGELAGEGTDRNGSSDQPPEGVRLERAILRILVEGLGGRIAWSDPETNGPGPAVYLPLARRGA